MEGGDFTLECGMWEWWEFMTEKQIGTRTSIATNNLLLRMVANGTIAGSWELGEVSPI